MFETIPSFTQALEADAARRQNLDAELRHNLAHQEAASLRQEAQYLRDQLAQAQMAADAVVSRQAGEIAELRQRLPDGATAEPMALTSADHFELRLVEAQSQQALLNDHCARLQVRATYPEQELHCSAL